MEAGYAQRQAHSYLIPRYLIRERFPTGNRSGHAFSSLKYRAESES